MPSSSLASYLAKNYLTADPSSSEKKTKKRKRGTDSKSSSSHANNGLSIADDDADTWTAPSNHSQRTNTHEEDDGPLTVTHGSKSADFRKKKASQWQTLSGAPASFANSESAAKDADQDAADAIIASAAAENEARRLAEQDNAEDAPAVVDTEMTDPTAIMSNGAHAGLQSAAAMAAQIASHKRREAEADESALTVAGGEGQGETIYRDATGRIVNIAMKRAEARAKAEAAEAKKRAAVDAARGDVQRAQPEERRQELEDAKVMTFARGADDEKLNDELKAREVWGDPMAGQLEGSGSRRKKDGGKVVPVVKKSITGRPLYAGSAQPNRYGIRPGHKWDGVDRGIGFESQWFKARNTRKDREALEWNWQMDE